MGIKVGVRKPIYPKWVNDAIKELFLDDKDQIVKCVIYALMMPTEDGIEIHGVLQNMSNRVSTLPSINEPLAALMIAESFMAWHTSQKRGDKIQYKR